MSANTWDVHGLESRAEVGGSRLQVESSPGPFQAASPDSLQERRGEDERLVGRFDMHSRRWDRF